MVSNIRKRLAKLEQQHRHTATSEHGEGLTGFYKMMEDPAKFGSFFHSLYGYYPKGADNEQH